MILGDGYLWSPNYYVRGHKKPEHVSDLTDTWFCENPNRAGVARLGHKASSDDLRFLGAEQLEGVGVELWRISVPLSALRDAERIAEGPAFEAYKTVWWTTPKPTYFDAWYALEVFRGGEWQAVAMDTLRDAVIAHDDGSIKKLLDATRGNADPKAA